MTFWGRFDDICGLKKVKELKVRIHFDLCFMIFIIYDVNIFVCIDSKSNYRWYRTATARVTCRQWTKEKRIFFSGKTWKFLSEFDRVNYNVYMKNNLICIISMLQYIYASFNNDIEYDEKKIMLTFKLYRIWHFTIETLWFRIIQGLG